MATSTIKSSTPKGTPTTSNKATTSASPTITVGGKTVTAADVSKAGGAKAWLAANQGATIGVQAAGAKTPTTYYTKSPTATGAKTSTGYTQTAAPATPKTAPEVAPTAPETPVTPVTPEVQEKVAPTATEITKEKTTEQKAAEKAVLDYQTADAKRLEEVKQNLATYATTNPELFADRKTFEQYFQYGARGKEQKAILDSFYKSQQTKNKELQALNTKISKYNALTGKALLNLSDADATLLSPDKQAERAALRLQQEQLDTLNGEVTTETPAEKTGIAKILEDWGITFDSGQHKDLSELYQQELDAIAPQKEEMDTAKAEYESVKNDYNNIYLSTKKELKGTGATDSYIRALAAKRQEDMQPAYQNAIDTYNNAVTSYNASLQNINQKMDLEYKDITLDRQAQMDNLQKLGFAYNLYKDTPEYQMQQAQIKYNIENPDLESRDPTTQRYALSKTLEKYYKDYGDIIQRPQAQVMSDVLSYAKKNNMSVSQALKENFITPLQNKKEYKASIAKKYGGTDWGVVGTDPQTGYNVYGFIDLINKSITPYGPSTKDTAQGPSFLAEPSGILQTVKTSSGKGIPVDSVVAPDLQSALNELGDTVTVAFGARTKDQYTQIIKDNAAKYGIPYNASNPEETRLKINQKAGSTIIASYESSPHTGGMAIDIYQSGTTKAVTADQAAILKKYGFEQSTNKSDLGHRNYVGKQGTDVTNNATLMLDALTSAVFGEKGTPSQKQGLKERFLNALQKNGKEGAIDYVKTALQNTLEGTVKTTYWDNEETIANLKTSMGLIDAYQTNYNKKFNWSAVENVGVLLKKGLSKAELASLGSEDRDLIEIYSSIQQSNAIIRNKLFGASLTSNEKKDSQKFLISPNDTSDIISAKMESIYKLKQLANDYFIFQKLDPTGNMFSSYKQGVLNNINAQFDVLNSGGSSLNIGMGDEQQSTFQPLGLLRPLNAIFNFITNAQW